MSIIDNYGTLVPEYCLYCGAEVAGTIRSEHDNALCKSCYERLYKKEV